MAQVTGPQSTGIRPIEHGSTVVAGGLAAAKDRAGVTGGANPAVSNASSNPISSLNFQAQAV